MLINKNMANDSVIPADNAEAIQKSMKVNDQQKEIKKLKRQYQELMQ